MKQVEKMFKLSAHSIVDPFIGKYSLIKVNSGVLKTDDLLYNVDREDVYKRQPIS